MMTVNSASRSSLLFLLRWILATSTGWLAALLLAWLSAAAMRAIPLPLNFDRDMIYPYAILLFLGLMIGISQALILRSMQISSPQWISLTFLGFLACLAIFFAANRLSVDLNNSNIPNNILLLTLMGTAVGVSQSVALRRHYQRSWIWILASTISFLFFLLIILNPTMSVPSFILIVVLIAGTGSILTGISLTQMRRLSDS
jgi:hypothetical protein